MSGQPFDFLKSIEDEIKANPGEYDAIIDFGSVYLFTELQNNPNPEVLQSYFKNFDGILKYIPYSLVADNIPEAQKLLGWAKNKNGNVLNNDNVEIRYLQTELTSHKKAYEAEDLFPMYESANGRARIVFANTPFYCSVDNTECNKMADSNRASFEQAIIYNDVDLVVSGFGEEYERTLPMYEGIYENLLNTSQFVEEAGMPVYITLNGPNSNEKSLANKKTFSVIKSSQMSYGVLEINSLDSIVYTQYSTNKTEIDRFTMALVEKVRFHL